ncbi:PRC-barrel domain-containing protein [uncultured Phenylobacterium sp.]|uniref:PRC-barrel domain-containing protein n=1 Tax=uncultured Phenylobacterium sp. TaxID=349273 RepID=UPI0025F47A8E|nr:PRC-barrel domain-containing protein [uncultured Phenylobacterium sp.]
MTTKKPEHPLIPADRVNGTDVVDARGDKLGKIEDVAIEKVSGNVAYAILSFGGLLGLGAKYHAVPWKALKYDEAQRAYVVPLSKSDLEKAPMIDESELSGWTDEGSREQIRSFYAGYGIGPYWI